MIRYVFYATSTIEHPEAQTLSSGWAYEYIAMHKLRPDIFWAITLYIGQQSHDNQAQNVAKLLYQAWLNEYVNHLWK